MEFGKYTDRSKEELIKDIGIMLRRLLEMKSVNLSGKHQRKRTKIEEVQEAIAQAVGDKLIWLLAGFNLLGISQKDIDPQRYKEENSLTRDGRRVVYNGPVKKLPYKRR